MRTEDIFFGSFTYGNNLTWTLDSDGTLIIYGSGPMTDEYYCSGLESYRDSINNIIIENGVTSIGEKAFYKYSNLKTVTIPPSLTKLRIRFL